MTSKKINISLTEKYLVPIFFNLLKPKTYIMYHQL